jgi:hypothetical protein
VVADADKGSEFDVSPIRAKAPVTRVYKSAGRGKKKLQTAREKENEIKAIVCAELGLTANMIRHSLQNRTGTHDLKKATPKRYLFQLTCFLTCSGNSY